MGGVTSVLKTERNNICVANVSDQLSRKYKETFSTDIDDQGSLYLFSNLVILNTVSSQVRIAVCKCLFRKPSAVNL